MHLVGLAVGFVAFLQLIDHVGFAGGGQERGQPVVVRDDIVADRARFDLARPATGLTKSGYSNGGSSRNTLQSFSDLAKQNGDVGRPTCCQSLFASDLSVAMAIVKVSDPT